MFDPSRLWVQRSAATTHQRAARRFLQSNEFGTGERTMRIGQLAALAIGIGVLTGCVTRPWDPSFPRTSCKDPTCTVSVVVAYTTNPFTCKIEVNPEVLDLRGGPAIQTLKWTVTGAKWSDKVDKLPINFGWNANSVMSPPVISGDYLSATVTYTRPSTGGNHYAYGVNLLTVIGEICRLDPWVVD
jgi:hypothetical protein